MALDKQRILSELGSVVNQLQSADCGCMGKLFSNPGQGASMGNPLPTCGGCRRGCCHGHGFQQGYSAPCAGEPCSNMNPMNYPMNRSCMGHCNPPKLYADTYNYLSENLMQPTIKDVYNDLKSITPANTVMNNPMASQMGLAQGGTSAPMQNNMPDMNQSSMPVATENQNSMQNMSGMPAGYSLNMGHSHSPQQMNSIQNNAQMGQTNQSMGQMNQPMTQAGGMGAHIVNMMMGERSKAGMPRQNAQLTEPMVIDAPQSPHGKVGVAPLSSPQQGMEMPNTTYGQQNYLNPVTQYTSQPNMYTENNGQGNQAIGNNLIPGSQVMQMGNQEPVKNSPATQQMTNPMYGQHSPGITKFNEMFPGVMQGGDLGFDPMAIAIQMNPANQQKTTMDTMQKLMYGNGMNRVTPPNSMMQPVINPTNSANANLAQTNANQIQNQPVDNTQNLNQPIPSQQIVSSGQMNQSLQQRQLNSPNTVTSTNQIPQQVYTANTGAPIMSGYHQNSTQQVPQYQQQQQQQPQMIDPNTGAVVNMTNSPAGNAGIDPNTQIQQPESPAQATPLTSNQPQEMIKEPIFPVDTSRNQLKPQKNYQYNTLGQPIEMLSAKMYHPPEPTLPQTLSPQPLPMKSRNDPMKYTNVKNTVSKTSIVGNKVIGRTPSRSQLQQIYNQYKGSQSYTQQNIRPTQHGQGVSYSEGNVTHRDVNQPQQVPVEKFGGDTVANNAAINNIAQSKPAPIMEQIGDVPNINKPQDNVALDKIPVKQSKCRNGLQDVVYTSYPTSAAWTFHGNNSAPFSTGYRFRNRAY